MSIAVRTSWIIERNIHRPLSLAGLAEACGVSRFHLAHAFGEATGRTVMRHVRDRRLSEAAKALVAGAPSILDLALAAGYASHEAFSRAFREAFGRTPEDVRAAGTTAGLALVLPLSPPAPARSLGAAGAQPALDVRREAVDISWVFVGVAATIAFEELVHEAPALWGRFMPRVHEIEDIADPIPWGVCRSVDDDGRLDYMAAVRVRNATGALPKGMVRVTAPPRTYAVFHHATHVARLRETYDAIWTRWLPASGETMAEPPSLERHCETFDPRTGEGGVDIWMPLEPASC